MNSQNDEKRELFEKTPVIKALITLCIPTVISQLIHLIYSLADTFFVGRTGNPYMLAGVSLAFSLFIFGVPFANLFGIGGGSLIARMMGAGETSEAKNVSAYSFWMGIIVSAAYSLVIFLFMEPILTLLGASENTMLYARQYTLLVVVCGTAPTTVSNILAHLLRNTGYSKQASYGLSGGGILNTILDPLFMFVIFPEGMEVFAAALATLISNILSCAYLAFELSRCAKRAPLSLSPSRALKLSPVQKKNVFSVGFPSAVLPGLMDVSSFFLNSMMSAHGDLQMAAIGICMKAERLPNCIGLGISQGMLPLVAYNYASGNHKRMNDTIKTGRLIGIGTAAVCIILYELFADRLCGLFMNTSGGAEAAAMTLAFATVFLRIRCLCSPFQFLNYHPSFCMQAMGDGRDTLIHATVRVIIVYIPMMYLLDALLGQNGLAAAFPASEAISAVLANLLLFRWIKKETAART